MPSARFTSGIERYEIKHDHDYPVEMPRLECRGCFDEAVDAVAHETFDRWFSRLIPAAGEADARAMAAR